jgi:hypothetical protein
MLSDLDRDSISAALPLLGSCGRGGICSEERIELDLSFSIFFFIFKIKFI